MQRNKRLIMLTLLLFLAATVITTTSGTSDAVNNNSNPAQFLLQSGTRLDGYQIYFTEDNGEASRFDRSEVGLSRLAGLLNALGAELLTLEWRTGIPSEADLIIIAGPTSDFSADQVARLWSYINNQGRVLMLVEPAVGRRGAFSSQTGFFALSWSELGIRGADDVIVTEDDPFQVTITPTPTQEPPEDATPTDEPEPSPTVARTPRATTTPVTIDAPNLIADFITTNVNDDHPITANLRGDIAFFQARSLETDRSVQPFIVTDLLFSERDFYGETQFDVYQAQGQAEFNIGQDNPRSALTLATAYENPINQSRMVLVGDADFALNGGGLQTSPPSSPSFLYAGNVRFLVNAVVWLLESESISLTFATPGPTSTPTVTASPTATNTPEPTATPTLEFTETPAATAE